MTCGDFDAAWTRRLDAGSDQSTDDERADLVRHLRDCPRCLAADARNLALERAIGGWAAPPRPLPIESERLVAALMSIRPEPPARSLVLRFVAAACVIAAGAILSRGLAPTPDEPILVIQPATESLPTVLADAGLATWRLARDTSAPAAKLGAALLDWSDRSEPPAAAPDEPRVSRSTEVLKSVGRRVNDGVEPLRSSALKAFDFLIAPAGGGGADRPGRGA